MEDRTAAAISGAERPLIRATMLLKNPTFATRFYAAPGLLRIFPDADTVALIPHNPIDYHKFPYNSLVRRLR